MAMAYYGISLSVQALSGNLYVNNTIMGLVEIPGYALAYLAVKYMSRPLAHGGFMLLSGIFILAGAFLSTGEFRSMNNFVELLLFLTYSFTKESIHLVGHILLMYRMYVQ